MTAMAIVLTTLRSKMPSSASWSNVTNLVVSKPNDFSKRELSTPPDPPPTSIIHGYRSIDGPVSRITAVSPSVRTRPLIPVNDTPYNDSMKPMRRKIGEIKHVQGEFRDFISVDFCEVNGWVIEWMDGWMDGWKFKSSTLA